MMARMAGNILFDEWDTHFVELSTRYNNSYGEGFLFERLTALFSRYDNVLHFGTLETSVQIHMSDDELQAFFDAWQFYRSTQQA